MDCETCRHSQYDYEEDEWVCPYDCDPDDCEYYDELDNWSREES